MLFLGRKEGAFRLGRGGMDSKQQQQQRQKQEEEGRQRRLERRNAAKNFEYGMAAGGVSWSSSSSSSCSSYHALSDDSAALRPTRSLDLPFSNQTSFRIAGSIDGEVDSLYRTLGLSGPEDFAIPLLAWEARKINSMLPTPPLALPPPPSMSLPAIDRMGSAWDIVRSFAPDEEAGEFGASPRKSSSLTVDVDEEDERDLIGQAVGEEEFEELRLGETLDGFTGMSSYSPMNDDDTHSMTTKTMFKISPNGKFKRKIKSWMRGVLLGSGSYGKVYEGISDDGVFFAIKEVLLLDQGINAPLQLEQEVALLSQFEHENIVQYYGTDKEESKLFIFLELVTQGSLASLYQKYHLRDTQVSAYTWQILHGLNYLHERNVVHRDIKCANILVHANGSVKLADFGLAKEITKFDMLKSCKGSVYWMAPEVVNPKKTYGPACDIWSLGCTVLEMLTRQIPYPSLEWTQALFKIGHGEQPPIPNYLSRDARDFISKCVKVNPDDRPSASQLLEHPFVKRSLPISTDSKSSSHLHKEI
ncbi:mitogen-activated protein kinase kinase kinase 1 isoform X4 [Musa acuminata AAA Group]|uniref:mitogen-activated protein kinase kinase kinase 1 isoform X4 n=1 Tax=Musa acuminata AAA Group TaxID=214697 RepID=UPI0031CFEA33